MHQERREIFRQLVEAEVRLYHPALGSLPARLEEWSPRSIRLYVDISSPDGHDFAESYFQLGADFIDVLFTMEFVRLDEQGLVLRFVDDGTIPGGDRL